MNTGGRRYSRRRVLGAGGTAAAALWTPWLWNPARASALEATLRRAASPEGTTLVTSLERAPGAGYVPLRPGPGWPTLPRAELAVLSEGRVDRRVPLASFVHLTDVHIIDAQSPGRVEYLDDVNAEFSAAFRPQELLTTHVQASMVDRIRSLRSGPITGRRFDCAVSTGDNIDNQQHNELSWFVGVLDGGTVTPNSGAPTDYEGVQLAEWGLDRYWHPDQPAADRYGTELGFPAIDGLLPAAISGFTSVGLDIPWYSTYGNHDGLLQGNLARTDAIDQLLMGDLKITGVGSTGFTSLIAAFAADTASIPERVRRGELEGRAVTADATRRTITTAEWVQAHLAEPSADSPDRPGPIGHGYDESHLDGDALYYRFDVSPGVVGLSLDTGGYNSGSIGESQLQWVEQQLRDVSSLWYDTDGNERCEACDDRLVVIFSHFTSGTMTGSADPTRPDERRVQGEELVATLLRYPNVIAWVNGHTHSNSIVPMPDPTRRGGGFWQITTASHVDYPEQARIVEVVDNGDETLSIFTTMIEHTAPATADYNDLSAAGLAAISRELSANNSVADIDRHVGGIDSLNCELGLAAPFPLTSLHPEPPREQRVSTTSASMGASPAIIGGVAAAAAVGGAIAVRRRRAGERGKPQPDESDGTSLS